MSDSGRQIGDCRHGNRREECAECVVARALSPGIKVISSAAMVGEKKTYLFTDGVLLVSPALESLMHTESLETLLATVKVVKMPFAAFPPDEAFMFGMTSPPPIRDAEAMWEAIRVMEQVKEGGAK